jgi:hypothetical protein
LRFRSGGSERDASGLFFGPRMNIAKRVPCNKVISATKLK